MQKLVKVLKYVIRSLFRISINCAAIIGFSLLFRNSTKLSVEMVLFMVSTVYFIIGTSTFFVEKEEGFGTVYSVSQQGEEVKSLGQFITRWLIENIWFLERFTISIVLLTITYHVFKSVV